MPERFVKAVRSLNEHADDAAAYLLMLADGIRLRALCHMEGQAGLDAGTLALLSGTTRDDLTSHLAELESAGIVEMTEGRARLADPRAARLIQALRDAFACVPLAPVVAEPG